MYSHNIPVSVVVLTAFVIFSTLLPVGAAVRGVRADRAIRSEWDAFELGLGVARQMAATSTPTRYLSAIR